MAPKRFIQGTGDFFRSRIYFTLCREGCSVFCVGSRPRDDLFPPSPPVFCTWGDVYNKTLCQGKKRTQRLRAPSWRKAKKNGNPSFQKTPPPRNSVLFGRVLHNPLSKNENLEKEDKDFFFWFMMIDPLRLFFSAKKLTLRFFFFF